MAYHSLSDPNSETTICGYVTKGCNLPPTINSNYWWNEFGRTITYKKINTLRNDKSKAIKLKFFGE